MSRGARRPYGRGMHQLKQQWLGVTLGILALFVALNGPALAADSSRAVARKLVTGKQVKDGSLQVKDLSKKARTALRGRTGPQGPQGPQGVPGPVAGVPAGGDLTGTFPDPQLRARSVGPAELEVIPSVRIVSTATDVPHNVTSGTVIEWGTGVSYESVDGMYDPAEGTRLVAPVDGIYQATATLGFQANGTGTRSVNIAIGDVNTNPACFDRDQAAADGSTFVHLSCPVALAAGNFVTIRATQTSGVSLGFSGYDSVSLTWVGQLT